MKMIVMMWMVGVAAAQDNGFGSAQLVSGSPEFESCLEQGSACQGNFYRFLSESMVEQGFAMQNHSQGTSVLVNPNDGFVAGASIATFPFEGEAVNLAGKTENTAYSPVFPRLALGWISGQEDRRVAAGVFFTPPVPVGGAQALQLGAEGGLALHGTGESGWGVEGDFTFLRATAPIVASQEQFEDRDQFNSPDNLDPETYEAVCGDTGCLDTFTMTNLGLRAGYGWALPSGLVPYLKGGLSVIREQLDVEYDATSWALFAIQPSLHGGAGWAAGEHLHLAAGASAALQQANQNENDQLGAFWKLDASAAWSF
jgi:opacity protein-like surface antigen